MKYVILTMFCMHLYEIDSLQDFVSSDVHSVCYAVSEKKNMVVTYETVPSVDMFQVDHDRLGLNTLHTYKVIKLCTYIPTCMLEFKN
jgi:hypothetical protein